MATYNKFQDYVEQLAKAKHDWSTHTFKVCLVAAANAPVATNTIFANLTEISAGNGYTAAGQALDTVTLSEASGTAKVTIADEVFTASGAGMAAFRYPVIYNDSQTSPADALVAYYDYGTDLTLASGETFTIDFDPTNGFWQMT